MKTIEVECAVADYFGVRQNIIVPNISWGLWLHEMDIAVIRPSGALLEVEIKVSVSDMKADLKKRHGHQDNQNRIKGMYYAMPASIYEKCLPYVPEGCGILVIHEDWQNVPNYQRVRSKREPATRKGYVKLTKDEMAQATRLGCLRIWTLKKNIIKLSK